MNVGLIIELTRRDFVERYSGSVLGVFWSFIWPFFNVFIYVVVFSKILGARLPGMSSATYGYSIYLVAGLLPWMAFSNTIMRASTVFVEKKFIISKVRVSLPSLPLNIVLSESITFLIAMIPYVAVVMFSGINLWRALLFAPLVYAIQQLLAYSLGLIIAMLNVFVRDIKEIVGVGLQVWFWFTPIIYTQDILPEQARILLTDFNPAYYFINAYQRLFTWGQYPDFKMLIAVTVLAHGLLLVAYLMFKKLERDIRDFL